MTSGVRSRRPCGPPLIYLIDLSIKDARRNREQIARPKRLPCRQAVPASGAGVKRVPVPGGSRPGDVPSRRRTGACRLPEGGEVAAFL